MDPLGAIHAAVRNPAAYESIEYVTLSGVIEARPSCDLGKRTQTARTSLGCGVEFAYLDARRAYASGALINPVRRLPPLRRVLAWTRVPYPIRGLRKGSSMKDFHNVGAFDGIPVNIDPAAFREAMSRHCSSVHVLTNKRGDTLHGLTVSTVCSVTNAPPMLFFCLHRDVTWRDALTVGAAVCVNTLSGDQQDIAEVFADERRSAERFKAGQWSKLATGAPVLDGAAVSCDCMISALIEIGDHIVIFANIMAIQLGPPESLLVYANRSYRKLLAADQSTR